MHLPFQFILLGEMLARIYAAVSVQICQILNFEHEQDHID